MLNRRRHFGAMCHGRKSRLFNLRENQRYNVFPVDLGVPPPSRRKSRGRRVTLQPQRDMSCEMGTLRVTHAIEKSLPTNKNSFSVDARGGKRNTVPRRSGIVMGNSSRRAIYARRRASYIYSCANLPASFLSATHALISMRIRRHKV